MDRVTGDHEIWQGINKKPGQKTALKEGIKTSIYTLQKHEWVKHKENWKKQRKPEKELYRTKAILMVTTARSLDNYSACPVEGYKSMG